MDGLFIKYGKNHLEQIINGSIRFVPSREYIKLEKEQHNKGQGDLLESKWVVHTESCKMESDDGSQMIAFCDKTKIVIKIPKEEFRKTKMTSQRQLTPLLSRTLMYLLRKFT